ncbi:oligosaccharide flippase family protein [Flavobacterium chungbukense]|uniref:Oligosaccharide flippase family protein n=1 Tax=Flavobacterium chungbukense TaxID=877464 RepID=A0ABP7XJU6_9FLAO|nr:oligosaccharide flippase family protein [Flavobacterium chungbukense]MCC4922973.1 hypothetical protein [Flavobacterium chungbukense]
MIKRIFKKSFEDRTKRANINILVSFFFRGGSILLSFILIPLTIDYIKPDAYGLWLTLTSLVGWVSMFDIGIANGLRNRLSESLADHDYDRGKIYVSTTYVIISLIASLLILFYFVFYKFVNWQVIFNSSFIAEERLQNVVTIVAVLFLLKFISDIINVVSAAFQMVYVSSVLLFLSNLGTTLAVWILSKTTSENMIFLALSLSFIPFLVSVIASLYLFRNNFNSVRPSLKHIDFQKARGIVGLGSQFFILQIISLIIFQTDNILIAQFFRPSEVTNFNIAYKYYSVVIIIFTIVLTPYWTAFTEAYFKKEYSWIKTTINRLLFYWIFSVVFLFFMFLISNWVIKLWIGDSVFISNALSLSICAYIAVTNWNAIFANFLNGVGKIRVQIVYAIIMGLINIPICFLLVKIFNFGTFAMPLSNFICLTFGALISYVQYNKIVSEKATGIWNK